MWRKKIRKRAHSCTRLDQIRGIGAKQRIRKIAILPVKKGIIVAVKTFCSITKKFRFEIKRKDRSAKLLRNRILFQKLIRRFRIIGTALDQLGIGRFRAFREPLQLLFFCKKKRVQR